MKVISEGGLDILKLSLISEYQSQFNKAIFCAWLARDQSETRTYAL